MDFHVGEYVQTRDGRTGYIEDVLLWTAIKCVFTHKTGKNLITLKQSALLTQKTKCCVRSSRRSESVILNHLLEKSSQSNSMMNLSV